MNTFKDRETAYEAKFAHDEEMQFQAISRRNKALARWVATKLGKTSAETDDYVTEVLKFSLSGPTEDAILGKIRSDLGGKTAPAEIEAMMADLLVKAQTQVIAER